jgi:hypothetical protein
MVGLQEVLFSCHPFGASNFKVSPIHLNNFVHHWHKWITLGYRLSCNCSRRLPIQGQNVPAKRQISRHVKLYITILVRSNKMQRYAGIYLLQLEFYVLLMMVAMDTRNM